MQIKKICFNTIKIGENPVPSIGLFNRDYQSLCLERCQIANPEFETLCVALGDENVMIIYIGFANALCFWYYLFYLIK